MPEITLGDALRLGSAIVPVPHSSEIRRCGVGMVYAAHGVLSLECATISLLYPGIIDMGWECPWCEVSCKSGALFGAAVIQHPFMFHYLTGEITLEAIAEWLDFISTRPDWPEMQAWMANPKRVIGRLIDQEIHPSIGGERHIHSSTVTMSLRSSIRLCESPD